MDEIVVYQVHERRDYGEIPRLKMDPQCGILSKPQGD